MSRTFGFSSSATSRPSSCPGVAKMQAQCGTAERVTHALHQRVQDFLRAERDRDILENVEQP